MINRLCKTSLLSIMLVCVANAPVDARVNVKTGTIAGSSRSQIVAAQQQAMAINQNTYVPATTTTLPLTVDDPNLEQDILNDTSDTVSTADLENCSMIYPNGSFKWAVPESGIRRNPTSQCVAIVELRDANTNKVLAQTTLAAGDMMKCNIDMFPQSGWQPALENVELPADNAPTLEDVEKVMNQEQKQHAGLKIAAGAILTGLAGNMLAPKEAGDTKLLGTSNDRLVSTAIAATAGAGVMAASTYSGKVAGDTIKSTAMTAATGAVVGNMAGGMAGGGESTLTIKKCEIKESYDATNSQTFDCIAGNIDTISNDTGITNGKDKDEYIYLINSNRDVKKCKETNNDDTANLYTIDGANYDCSTFSASKLLKIQLSNNSGDTFDNIRVSPGSKNLAPKGSVDVYNLNDKSFNKENTYNNVTSDSYFKIHSASFSNNNREHGYAVFTNEIPNKVFGYKLKDWETLKKDNPVRYYVRNSDGSVGPERKNTGSEIVFTPLETDSDDGGLVDFSNKGRIKATMSGAVAGGALGGFAAYQGAKQEVQERWLSATREYNDSLSNFYCGTGTRFLSSYNSYIEIPMPKQSE